MCAGVLGNLDLEDAVAGDREIRQAHQRLHPDCDRIRIRVVNEGIRLVPVGRRSNGCVVGVIPLGHRVEREPVALVVRRHVACDEVNLNRLRCADPGAFEDAAIDLVRFAAVEGRHDLERPVCILVYADRGAVLGGLHKECGIFEHRGGGDVCSDRRDVFSAVIKHRADFNGTAQHAARRCGPACARNGDGLR